MIPSFDAFFTQTSLSISSDSQTFNVKISSSSPSTECQVFVCNVSTIIFQQKSRLYQISSKCKMIPIYEERANNSSVVRIDLHSEVQNFPLTLSTTNSNIGTVYETLKRVISHKGFGDFYRPLKRLGRGTFATVYLIEHKFTKIQRAAKVFSREGQKIQFKGKEALQNEISILREVDHPNIVKYDGIYQTENLIYLVTEYLSGGTLEEMMKNKSVHTGEFVSGIIRDILYSLKYLDQRSIMHRDIKPENIILRKEDSKWVLSDFGLAAKSNTDYIYNKCGTMGYIAPEIMEMNEENPKRYSQECDIYSLGIIAYTLIIGSLPFHVETENFYDKKIVWDLFEKPQCKQLNKEILSFLKCLLDPSPKNRYKASQALKSEFFEDCEVVKGLYEYHERRRQERYDRILQLANTQY